MNKSLGLIDDKKLIRVYRYMAWRPYVAKHECTIAISVNTIPGRLRLSGKGSVWIKALNSLIRVVRDLENVVGIHRQIDRTIKLPYVRT